MGRYKTTMANGKITCNYRFFNFVFENGVHDLTLYHLGLVRTESICRRQIHCR